MEKINVAIADDFAMFTKGLTLLLDSYQEINVTQTASNGKVLIKQIKDSTSKPDIILMDIEMPIMNGYEATKEVLKILPNCKILYLSYHNSQSYIEIAMKSKGHGYLLKSCSSETLLSAIKDVYYKGFYHNEYFSLSKLLKVIPKYSNLSLENPV